MPKRSSTKVKSSSQKLGRKNSYTDAFRRKVVTYSVKNGIIAVADKFSVSTPSVTNWRKDFGVTRATKRRRRSKGGLPKKPVSKPVPSGRKNIRIPSVRKWPFPLLRVEKTAIRFGVSAPSVTNWRREFGINRETRDKIRKEHEKMGITNGKSLGKKILKIRRQVEKSLALLDSLLQKM